MLQKYTITLEDARRVAEAAHKTATENEWNVVISVVDDGGHLVYLERMNDVQNGFS
jgi:glc operon protein GlcG